MKTNCPGRSARARRARPTIPLLRGASAAVVRAHLLEVDIEHKTPSDRPGDHLGSRGAGRIVVGCDLGRWREVDHG